MDKQIDRLIDGLFGMHGDLKGIAGADSIPKIDTGENSITL